jgi:predicted RNA-binding Zn-ribbon protein involved in translation (DUF1610 family)
MIADPISLILLLVVLAIVVLAARGVWLAVVPPRRCVKEASCETCKYPVTGLSAWTCPECGSHLLTVGIVTRSMEMRRRGSYLGAICGLLTLTVFAVGLGLSIAMPMLRAPVVHHEHALFWSYVLVWAISSFGVLLFTLLSVLIIRRRRKLLSDAEHLALPVAPSPA